MAETGSVNITKTTAATATYRWVFSTRGSRKIGLKQVNGTVIELQGADDTELMRRVNGYESYRNDRNLPKT